VASGKAPWPWRSGNITSSSRMASDAGTAAKNCVNVVGGTGASDRAPPESWGSGGSNLARGHGVPRSAGNEDVGAA